MGDILGGIFGGNDAGGNAAGVANAFSQDAIKELRRQFGVTQENLAPFIAAGTGALPGVVEGSTPGGLDARLGEIFNTDIFGTLVDERTRAVEGQLAAGGLMRSGTAIREAANVPTSLGLALEELLSGRLGALAGAGQSAAAGLGSLGAQNSSNIADILLQQGQNAASGILTDAQANAQGGANVVNAAATAARIFFSDPALKTNVEEISAIYIEDPKNQGEMFRLPLVEWDWVPATKGTMIEKCGTVGFMADRVQEIFPEFVSKYCGLLVVDYPGLLDRLETK